jgi:hypothetical protein
MYINNYGINKIYYKGQKVKLSLPLRPMGSGNLAPPFLTLALMNHGTSSI